MNTTFLASNYGMNFQIFLTQNSNNLVNVSVFGSATLGDKLPAGSSYLPPNGAASSGYGAPDGQAAYGGGSDYYDDADYSDEQASYSNDQVSLNE